MRTVWEMTLVLVLEIGKTSSLVHGLSAESAESVKYQEVGDGKSGITVKWEN